MLWQWANNRTQVFILDLDGTLMPSAEIDNQCFWQAVFECFGKRGELPDLHGFKHVTDSGILGEWCSAELGRPANPDEIRQIRAHFLQLLEQAAMQYPGHFDPLAGVHEWLTAIQQSSGVFAAIATGGWGHSARLKLRLSGLDRFSLPLASSDDAISRTEIMQIAFGRVHGLNPLEPAKVTYIGDGAWDLKASQELDWDFIGIASGVQAADLRNAGASYIETDFMRP